MTFTELIRSGAVVLTEGAVIERLRRDPAARLDPHVLNTALLYDPADRARLAAIYDEYIAVGRKHRLPLLLGAPTWRANAERLEAAGLLNPSQRPQAGQDRTAAEINADAVRFMQGLRAKCGAYGAHIYIGGLLSCHGDAYRPDEALGAADAERFHQPQANALAGAGVDFLLAATLPAVSEAIGLARALARTSVPYLLSFVLRPDGTCLDGTPLGEAVGGIDAQVSPPPTAYLANCVHPQIFAAALTASRAACPEIAARVIGLQANTSRCSPAELDGRAALDAEPPAVWAAAMLSLRRQFQTRILGGCCGTDTSHIAALAAGLSAERR